MTDVLLFQTDNDGDIAATSAGVELTDGLQTAVYLSMFGGNEDAQPWWGDLSENDPANTYPARTAKAINAAIVTPSRMLPIKDAVLSDLSWVVAGGYAQAVDVDVTIPSVNAVKISVNIDGETVFESNQAGPTQ